MAARWREAQAICRVAAEAGGEKYISRPPRFSSPATPLFGRRYAGCRQPDRRQLTLLRRCFRHFHIDLLPAFFAFAFSRTIYAFSYGRSRRSWFAADTPYGFIAAISAEATPIPPAS